MSAKPAGRRFRVPLAALAVLALVLVVSNLLPLVLDGGGLGHDEAAYALKARHWIDGTPETGWNLHRGVATSAYGYLVFAMGGGEGALRLFGLAALVGFVAAIWILGDRIGGKWVGPLSAIALLSAPVLLRRSTEFLSDVPSAALLVAMMIVVWSQFGEREKPGYRLLWLLPFAWAAFYVRYQSVLSFGLIALTIGILFGRKVKRGWRPVVLTAVVGLVGLIPHFVFAVSETGSPLGILFFTADVAGRDYWGQGLVDYFSLMAGPLAAFIGPLAVLFFVWWLIADWRSVSQRTRCLFLMIPAVAQVLILGVLSHGEARFIFFPLALTLIGGVTGAMTVVPRWKPRTARVVRFGLIVLLIGSFALAAVYVRRAVDNRAEDTEIIVAAANQLRETSGGQTCGVVTSYFPQITYYSDCYTQFFRDNLDPEETLGRLDGETRFMLLVEEGKSQPDGEQLSEFLARTSGPPIRVTRQGDHADIYAFPAS